MAKRLDSVGNPKDVSFWQKPQPAIEYLKIVATDFKCFQFLSLIGQFLPEVPAADGKVH